MIFNSYIFVLFFLPVCIMGYFAFNRLKKYVQGKIFLLFMSLWFYAYYNTEYIVIILVSVGFNYSVYKILRYVQNKKTKKEVLAIGIAINMAVLVYFKYTNFLIENINYIFQKEYTLLNIIMPLGISFFTFQQMSFIVDTYRGETQYYRFIDYACYVTFFPQLISGPIVTHNEMIPQFNDMTRKSFDWNNFSSGIYLFILGLGKKIFLADIFGKAVTIGYMDVTALDSTNAIIVMLSYTFQIYFDFSGYCDMAMGIAKMLNFELPVNFDSPYKALTINEFWERWHITLTRFFTKYVYIPMGGSHKGKIRTYVNIMIVFLLSGLWHGANWTFVFWGGMHGIFCVFSRHFKKQLKKLHPALNWFITFAFVNITWVFFRAKTLTDAVELIRRICRLHFGSISGEIAEVFKIRELLYIFDRIPNPYCALGLFLMVGIFIILGCDNAYEKMQQFKPSVVNLFGTAFLLACCIYSFSGLNTFLYFNF